MATKRLAPEGAKPALRQLSYESPGYVLPGLTLGQIAARYQGLGGSDAERIMAGKWKALWLEKTKRSAPEDLSAELAVQMGNVTEAFNAWWFEQRTGIAVNRAPVWTDQSHFHRQHEWMLCNIDGLVIIDKRERLFEAKHTNPFGSKGEAPARYLAQVQHCLEVMNLEGCEMSVLFGNSDWMRFSIERDHDYGALLIEREAEFWDYVVTDKPPPADAGAGPPAPGLELMRAVDMRQDNVWNDKEVTWMDNRPARVRFDEAESELKAMMPGDADFAYGQSLVCVRDRAGKLSLRYPNMKDLDRRTALIEKAEKATEGLEL
jgi:hypothetical protein